MLYYVCMYIYIQFYTIGKVFQTSSCCNLLTLSWATDLGCIRNNHLGSATPISRAILWNMAGVGENNGAVPTF